MGKPAEGISQKSFRLPDEVIEGLRRRAKEEGKSQNKVLTEVLSRVLVASGHLESIPVIEERRGGYQYRWGKIDPAMTLKEVVQTRDRDGYTRLSKDSGLNAERLKEIAETGIATPAEAIDISIALKLKSDHTARLVKEVGSEN